MPLLLVASGCPSPDAAGKYDRFNEETEDDRDQPEPKQDIPPPENFADISGVYLLALETSIAPGLPLQFVVDVQADLDLATGDGPVSLDIQPLSLDVMSTTEPREEVGESIAVDTMATEGRFTVDFGVTMVTGEANPITGSDITADLALEANVRSEDYWCGIVTGDVQSPIQAPLDGSTFAATRLADRSERPEEFAVKCDDIVLDDEGTGGGSEGGTEDSGGETGGSGSTG